MYWLVLLSLAQTTNLRALDVLTSPRARWGDRSSALTELSGHDFNAAEVERLHRAALVLSRQPPRTCTPRSDCEVMIDECLSPAGYLLAAVDRTNAAPQFVDVALLVLDEKKDSRAVPLARRILASARHPRVEGEARQLLETNEYSCLEEGAFMLLDVERLTPETQASIEALARESTNARAMGQLVGVRPEPWARALAMALLSSADTGSRLGVVRGMASVFPSDDSRRVALAKVARCDPSTQLQREVKSAFEANKVVLPALACAPMTWTATGAVVTGPAGERVELSPASTVPPPTARCAKAATKGLVALGMVGSTCVLAANHGEFGGQLFGDDASGTRKRLSGHQSGLNPVALLTRGDEVLVINALAHLVGTGGVGRLKSIDGELRYERWLHFTGLPMRWAVSKEHLVLQFEPDEFTAPCNRKEAATMIIEPDRTFTLAGGSATACLAGDTSPSKRPAP